MRIKFVSPPYWLVLLLTILLGTGVFLLSYRLDNKYRFSSHQARDGVLHLDEAAYEKQPLLFLVDGWAFYQYRLLTPVEVEAATPDAYLFLGQYGGFELDDPDADPHGCGTYRLTIFTEGEERDYALELPEIYSAYRVWINGEFRMSEGTTDAAGYTAKTSNSIISFRGSKRIDILVAVSDYSGFYSGMVYPPLLGSPEAVYRLSAARLLVHGGFCFVALVILVFCLVWGIFRREARNHLLLSFLCFCFLCYASYPLVHTLGLPGSAWYRVEQMGYMAMITALIWLQGRVCSLPRRLYRTAFVLSMVLCIIVTLFPYQNINRAADLYRLSDALALYRWLGAAYLIAAGVWGVTKKHVYSKPLLAGCCIFGCSLLVDRAFPLFEPIVFGWHGELAGFMLILLTAGILLQDTVRISRDSLAIQLRNSLLDMQLSALQEQFRIEQDWAQQIRLLHHEMRHNLSLLQIYAANKKYARLEAYLNELLDTTLVQGSARETSNDLIEAILDSRRAAAEKDGIRFAVETAGIPPDLPVSDQHMGSLLLNILDNALDACRKAPEGNRWIAISLRWEKGLFLVRCENSHAGELRLRQGRLLTSKTDPRAHGYGLSIIRQITDAYCGTLETSFSEDRFCLRAALGSAPGENTI